MFYNFLFETSVSNSNSYFKQLLFTLASHTLILKSIRNLFTAIKIHIKARRYDVINSKRFLHKILIEN